MTVAIRVANISKTFNTGRALDGVNLFVREGEMVALLGASGSGKSLLLRHIAGFTAGDATRLPSSIHVFSHCVQNQGALTADLRTVRSQVGIVLQRFNVAGRLPVIINVLAGLRYPKAGAGNYTADEIRAGLEALDRVGMAGSAMRDASALSTSEQQTVAIARALVRRSRIILADEPADPADPVWSGKLMDLLHRINREDGITVLLALRSRDMVLRYCARAVALHRGRIVYDGVSSRLAPRLLRRLCGPEADELLYPMPFGAPKEAPGRVSHPAIGVSEIAPAATRARVLP